MSGIDARVRGDTSETFEKRSRNRRQAAAAASSVLNTSGGIDRSVRGLDDLRKQAEVDERAKELLPSASERAAARERTAAALRRMGGTRMQKALPENNQTDTSHAMHNEAQRVISSEMPPSTRRGMAIETAAAEMAQRDAMAGIGVPPADLSRLDESAPSTRERDGYSRAARFGVRKGIADQHVANRAQRDKTLSAANDALRERGYMELDVETGELVIKPEYRRGRGRRELEQVFAEIEEATGS